MADQEPSMSQVLQATRNESLNIPPAKMIRLEDLEKTVLGLVKKSLNQTTQQTGDRAVLPPGNRDNESTVGQ